MDDLLAEFENGSCEDNLEKIVLAQFDTTEAANAEIRPMGYKTKAD